MGKLGKSLGKVAGIAAPFLPPGWSQAASIGGSLLAGNEAQDAADANNAKIGQIGDEQLRLYQMFGKSILPAMMTNAGVSPDGTYNPNYNPNASLAEMLFGDTINTDRAARDYDPSMLMGQILGSQEANDAPYDNAVAATEADGIGRGFIQGDTGTDANVANIRQGQAAQDTAFRRDLFSRNAFAKRDFVQRQEANRAGLLTDGLSRRDAALNGVGSLTAGSAQGAVGTLGGLGGMYQSRADNVAQGQGELLGDMAGNADLKNMDFGKMLGLNRLRRRNQSQSFGTTTAQSPSRPAYDNVYNDKRYAGAV